MNYIVSPEWVNNQINTDTDIAIIDVRFSLNEPNEGRELYEKTHIKGAFYLDLNEDLSSQPQKHGGNHPLPDIDLLATKLGNIGIDHDTTVVFYDNGNDMVAARAWWLLYFMGHEKTYILDGGITKWQQLGLETTDELPERTKKEFTPHIKQDEIVNMEAVKNRQKNKSILIDARANERYLGKTEPLYNKAGHIPGAKNYFWKNVYEEDGSWKQPEKLRQELQQFLNEDVQEIFVSCCSGVSACPNIVALKMAGIDNVKLYPGSFSDWISYPENKLETKDETFD